MKKLVTITCAAAMSVLSAQAASIGVGQAQALAQQFASRGAMRAPSQAGATLALAHQAQASGGLTDYYVFNRGNNEGYILVAGDDTALPVLGYSNSGSFDYDQLPENAKWWLEQYQKEIQWLRQHPGTQPRKAQQLATSVSPLLSTIWDQTKPFNNQCPTYSTWFGTQHCATGCVATATAQIMKFHQWPVTGKGSHTYTATISPGYWGESYTQTLSADFSQSTYQWSQMLNSYKGSYSTAQADAVAKLMSDVGIAEDMSYGTSSGTSSYKAFHALKTYFDYDATMQFLMRDFYDLDVWEQMLRDELDAHRPVYYAGSSDDGAHAFVFDGYDTRGYFHVNWGWSGTSDGYFACSALNPSSQGTGGSEGGYNSDQDAIIGIKPNAGGVPVVDELQGYNITFATNAVSQRLGGNVTFQLSGVTFLGEGTWNSLMWGITVTDDTGEHVLAHTWKINASDISIGSSYGVPNGMACALPTGLTNGVYRIYSAYSIDGQPGLFKRPVSTPYLTMTVVDGTAYFSGEIPESRARLALISDIAPDKAVMPANDVQATAVVQAEEADWTGTLTACIMDCDGDAYTTLATIATDISVAVNKQVSVTFNGAFEGQEGHTYYLSLLDPVTGEVWGGYAPFTVGQLPAELSKPLNGDLLNFGATTQGSTNIQTLNILGENLTQSLTLTLSGSGASYYKLSSSSVTAAAAMRGSSVRVTYRPTAAGRHDATLTIAGGGLAQPVTVALTGIVPTSTAVAQGTITAPDFKVTEADTASVIAVPLTMTLPAGTSFTDVQLVVTLPDGLKPCANDEGIYGMAGADAAVLTFTDNLSQSARWPRYTITGGSAAHTAVTANPCQIYTLHLTADTTFTQGIRDIVAYATYATSAGEAFTMGSSGEPLLVAHVTFGDEVPMLKGDVNGDGAVDIDDVNIIINVILEMDRAENYGARAYVTDDDVVDIADVNALINIILTQ